MENTIQLGFIGAGNMARAIISGISNSSLAGQVDLFAADVDAAKVEALKQYNVRHCANVRELVSTCQYILLAVKPQNFESILQEIKPYASKDAVYISIAAGITVEYISSQLGFEAKVVLVMPNTPLMLGEGASALSKSANVTEEEFSFVSDLFAQSGEIAVIQPEQMNAVIPINGSAPAFVYLFAKSFVEYGKAHEIPEDVALSLFAQTLTGSAKMLTHSGKSIDELITMVSSPGGTTLKGLDSFYESRFEDIVVKACEATLKRAEELGK